jgi:anti-sigma B factor antagonist
MGSQDSALRHADQRWEWVVSQAGFPVERAGELAVLLLPAEVDISSADLLRDQLLGLINDGVAVLIVDMSLTTFCDSAAVGALITAHRRAGEAGVVLRLVAAQAGVLRVMTIIGVDRLIPVYPTVSAARSATDEPARGAASD